MGRIVSRNRSLAATGLIVAVLLFPVVVCCSVEASLMVQQPECCKGRCATVSVTSLIAPLAPVKPRIVRPIVLPTLLSTIETGDRERCSSPAQIDDGWNPSLFPIATIQLRI